MDITMILAVSFGTTHTETCERNIGAVEGCFREAFPGTQVRRAFTSGMVRAALASRGIEVEDVRGGLRRAIADGYSRVLLQPTHLLYGDEYEKMRDHAGELAGEFERLEFGEPLLAGTGDLRAVAAVVSGAFPAAADTAVVLMGHGTRHYVNPVYAGMQTMFRLMGRPDILLGTVEAWPGIDEVLWQLESAGYSKVVLTPFMLVAGDHAANDMAGDGEDSWRGLIEGKGLRVSVVMRGLGEYAGIREIYASHARQGLNRLGE